MDSKQEEVLLTFKSGSGLLVAEPLRIGFFSLFLSLIHLFIYINLSCNCELILFILLDTLCV